MRRALIPLLGILLFCASSCSNGGGSGIDEDEDTPPSRIVDLTVAQTTCASVTLSWTAPSGGGESSSAASYDLRCAAAPIDKSNWNETLEIEDEPTPGFEGLRQSMVLTGVPPDTLVYFAMRACSSSGTWSEISNSPVADIPPETPVAFADPALESVVRALIQMPEGQIMPADLVGLTEIDASQREIRDLDGIQYCVSLRRLGLRGNGVAELGPLTGLVGLTDLDVSINQVSDISPLGDLTSLMNLDLSGNAITDIAALQGMEVLNFLWLGHNLISDLGPVAGCWRLNHLFAPDNQILELGPLSTMKYVADLDLSGNLVLDLAPLVANVDFGDGDRIWLARNPLSAMATDEQIPALRNRGVIVYEE